MLNSCCRTALSICCNAASSVEGPGVVAKLRCAAGNSCRHTGQVLRSRSQGSTQASWKQCRQGICKSSSPASKSSWQTVQGSPTPKKSPAGRGGGSIEAEQLPRCVHSGFSPPLPLLSGPDTIKRGSTAMADGDAGLRARLRSPCSPPALGAPLERSSCAMRLETTSSGSSPSKGPSTFVISSSIMKQSSLPVIALFGRQAQSSHGRPRPHGKR